MIAAREPLGGWGRITGVALQPISYYVMVKLLRPQHSGKALTHDVLRIRRKVLRNDRSVEVVGLALARGKCFIETGEGIVAFEIGIGKTQANHGGFSCTDGELVMNRRLCASRLRVHRLLVAVHDVVVDAVFDVRSGVLDSKQAARVGFIFREQ